MSGEAPYLMLILMLIASRGEPRRREGAGCQEERERHGL